jgi:hypothetical protein
MQIDHGFMFDSTRLELIWCELVEFKYEFASVMIDHSQLAFNSLLLCLISYC